jgi:hypothetical protein
MFFVRSFAHALIDLTALTLFVSMILVWCAVFQLF